MVRIRVLLGVLTGALTLSVTAAAHGGSVGDVLPRPVIGLGGDDPAHAALTCGLAAFSDPTGLVEQASTMKGPITGGPWAVADVGTTMVTVTCTVQTNSADPDAEPSATVRRTARASSTPGNVGILVDTVIYDRYDGDDVYVCTAIDWRGSNGPRSWEYDADDTEPGVQCDRAVTVEF